MNKYQYLYDHSTFLQPGETVRPAIIRLKVKIIANPPAEIDPELPILTLKLFYYGKLSGTNNYYFTDPLSEQIITLTMEDIHSHCDYQNIDYDENDYNWASFDINPNGSGSGEPVFIPVLLHGSLSYQNNGTQMGNFTGLLPNISVCSPAAGEFSVQNPDISYTVFIDSMEVWEEDAFDLLFTHTVCGAL